MNSATQREEARDGLSSEELLRKAPTEYVVPQSVGQALWTLPQNVAIAFLRLYRALISPLYGDVCRYFPSCSAYGLEAFTVHGAVRGLGLTVRRLLKCHPWATGGVDPVPQGSREFRTGSLPKILLLNHPLTTDVHDAPRASGQGANSR